MKKEIILVGAGSYSQEIKCWIETSALSAEFQCVGVIDDNSESPSIQILNLPYLGSISSFAPTDSQWLVMGISEPTIKLKIARALKAKNARFATIIHPTAIVATGVELNEGVTMCPYSVVSLNTRLGAWVQINVASSVGHDVSVGEGSTISSHCDIAGFVCLGEGVFLGSRSGIIPKVEVGDYAKISAGSTVYRRVKPHTTVIGTPAKVLM